jgi:tRNA-specific 2-thiouridylase
MCNNWLRFGRLWDFARQVDADYIASGHYAQLRPVEGERQPGLFRGLDRDKDQSYVLFGIRRDLLDRVLYPVGTYTKSEIRDVARRAGIRTADKPDSQEICFIPDNDYAAFLDRYRGPQETAGDLVDTAGNVVGSHAGYQHFTIGQRKGLGVTFGSPRFVVRIEPETRRVVIGMRDDLARTSLEADRANWLCEHVPTRLACSAQIRYQHRAASCTVDVDEGDRFRVAFDEPQYGVAPGQAVVLYDGDRVLGGGWIC